MPLSRRGRWGVALCGALLVAIWLGSSQVDIWANPSSVLGTISSSVDRNGMRNVQPIATPSSDPRAGSDRHVHPLASVPTSLGSAATDAAAAAGNDGVHDGKGRVVVGSGGGVAGVKHTCDRQVLLHNHSSSEQGVMYSRVGPPLHLADAFIAALPTSCGTRSRREDGLSDGSAVEACKNRVTFVFNVKVFEFETRDGVLVKLEGVLMSLTPGALLHTPHTQRHSHPTPRCTHHTFNVTDN
jgi:hypothetical protein